MSEEEARASAPGSLTCDRPPDDRDAASVTATTRFLAYLAEATGPDDPAYRAASLLAEAWRPALDRSYRLGYENGYTAGYYAAERELAELWRAAAEPVERVLAMPTYAELQRRRGEAG